MDFREHKRRGQKLRSLPKQLGHDFARAPMMRLPVVPKGNPERGVDENPIAVDHRFASSANVQLPFAFTYLLGVP